MDKFFASYVETALWSSTDEQGIPLDDSRYADTELAPETIGKMTADCLSFEDQANTLLETYCQSDGDGTTGNYTARREQLAHDFWLTRNHHGVGFWDGDYPEPLGQKLTDLAQSFPECDLYVGDDGKFYL